METLSVHRRVDGRKAKIPAAGNAEQFPDLHDVPTRRWSAPGFGPWTDVGFIASAS